jgi:hypothetical protein
MRMEAQRDFTASAAASEREEYGENWNVVGGMEPGGRDFEATASGKRETMPQVKPAKHKARRAIRR